MRDVRVTARRRAAEDGQTLVVFVLFLVVCLSFMAVVIDSGMYFFERREMQGSADAAALAAVRELPDNPAEANAEAGRYVNTHNGDNDGAIRVFNLSDNNRRVEIRVGKPGTTNFGALLGVDSPEISARAVARVQMMGPRPGMLPMAFMRDSFNIGQNYEIMWDNPGGGNRGAIAPNMMPNCGEASGSDDFRNLIQSAEYGGIDACATPIAETLDTEPGQMAGPTRQGFDARLSGNSDSFSDVFGMDADTGFHTIEKPESPRIGIVPVIENINGDNTWPNGRSQPIRILAYMLVYIGKVDSPGYPAYTDNGRSVWVTPVRPILPADYPDGGFVDYDTDLPAPVVYRLVE